MRYVVAFELESKTMHEADHESAGISDTIQLPIKFMKLAEEVFTLDDADEEDNDGQKIIYTNIVWDKNSEEYRQMTEKDLGG